MGGVGEAQHVVADEGAGSCGAEGACPEFTEGPVVGVNGQDGKLLNDKPIEMLPLDFLPRHEIKRKRIETRGQQVGVFPVRG